ncbi:MAG TPA: hypothetical protein VEI06_13895 [Gemmatimonadaceae bacterium]|nr:hypothetical protein [Gemmatimonadaceae bacterium]
MTRRTFHSLTRLSRAALSVALAGAPLLASAQATFDARQAPELRWRMIGPFRGGRTKSATGVPSQPNVFYIGVVNGGVWKSTDYGRTWDPIFDAEPTGSIGAVEVSPSNPNIVYVGTGEGLQRPDLSTGNGIYKSIDAGKTWTHLGLPDGQQIPRIALDPRNPDRLFVAVLGHPYGPNEERGVYRSTDGGRTFERVLYRDENTGAADIMMAPDDPNTLYAALWESRQAPWENGHFDGPGSGLFKSTDGGATWRRLTDGLPGAAEHLGRIGIAVAPSDPKRLYITATADSLGGVYRSDDGGEHWRRATGDVRIWGRGDDFAAPVVDPKNPDVLYSANVVAWKSTDGGATWQAHRGAPGGDDYQRYWINPNDPRIILLVSDQGAVVTVNGGETWSSWYNQPTAQMYHVTADNAFPYRLCGGQQESGSACVQSRGDDGSIGYREWRPVGAEEYGYVAPDPLDPDIVYGGKLSRWDRRSGQAQEVAPSLLRTTAAGLPYRVVRTEPVLFSPTNPRVLYFASNVVWKTTTGGKSWTRISPDLTRESWEAPRNVGKYAGTAAAKSSRRGVVYALAPSPVDSNTIWAGTDDGLIQVTRNGGRTWANVTPPQVTPWAKVSIIDASHSDANVAYAAINTFRLDDLRPHIFRTGDGGKSWREIVSGIDSGAAVNVVREDPKRRGLLYAGSEARVWVSFDDGEQWHALQLNMPVTSIRDLIVKDDDIAVATHGRGFWILDDVTALRQWTKRLGPAQALLFAPQRATRIRYSTYPDTPVPPDEPMAENPPDGAIIDYWLASDAKGPLSIDILDATGKPVRHYSSDMPAEAPRDQGNWPAWWFRPFTPPSATAGLHRFVWDLHYEPLQVPHFTLSISATPHNTPREPRGPVALPGKYTVRVTVDGQTLSQSLSVRMDPRVKTPTAALQQQFALSQSLAEAINGSAARRQQIAAMRATIGERASSGGNAAPVLGTLDNRLASLGGRAGGGQQAGASGAAADSYTSLERQMLSVYRALQSADGVPTDDEVSAARDRRKAYDALETRWQTFVSRDLPAANKSFAASGLPPVEVPARGIAKVQNEAGDEF